MIAHAPFNLCGQAEGMATRLEGPGSEERLRALQRGFRRASPSGRPATQIGLFIGVFALVFISALILMERPGLISEIASLAGRRASEPASAPAPYRYFSGCNAARAAGAAPIYRGQPGYRQEMDGDNDGIACEPYPR